MTTCPSFFLGLSFVVISNTSLPQKMGVVRLVLQLFFIIFSSYNLQFYNFYETKKNRAMSLRRTDPAPIHFSPITTFEVLAPTQLGSPSGGGSRLCITPMVPTTPYHLLVGWGVSPTPARFLGKVFATPLPNF